VHPFSLLIHFSNSLSPSHESGYLFFERRVCIPWPIFTPAPLSWESSFRRLNDSSDVSGFPDLRFAMSLLRGLSLFSRFHLTCFCGFPAWETPDKSASGQLCTGFFGVLILGSWRDCSSFQPWRVSLRHGLLATRFRREFLPLITLL